MRNILVIGIVLFATLFNSCNDDDDTGSSMEQEQQVLIAMLNEIQTIVNSTSCIDATKWTYTAIGAKACGGPMDYIAYSTTIDIEDFLKKVNAYTDLEDAFNKKWGIISDCSIEPEPKGVACEDEKPTLLY
ncbi:hypothetical protein [uncultured Aquimarina sp.]|uniref:hypothetical protein n=1 Tax=uncultured Aquimarina sp. TaxID=575652 RepID=UPI0026126504|nr:hypothetical protein [uncultured Aquimarina sp.]